MWGERRVSEENGEKQGSIENGYLVINKGNELNPLLKKYFNAYTAIAPNLRYLLTGSEIGHTLKKTSIYGSKSNGFIDILLVRLILFSLIYFGNFG